MHKEIACDITCRFLAHLKYVFRVALMYVTQTHFEVDWTFQKSHVASLVHNRVQMAAFTS